MAGIRRGSAARRFSGIVIALGVLGLSVPAWSADAARGKDLAERWCNSCHIIDNSGAGTAADRAPPFPELAGDLTKTTPYLEGFLTVPHYPMPDLQLSRRDINDLVAHIQSLKQGKK